MVSLSFNFDTFSLILSYDNIKRSANEKFYILHLAENEKSSNTCPMSLVVVNLDFVENLRQEAENKLGGKSSNSNCRAV